MIDTARGLGVVFQDFEKIFNFVKNMDTDTSVEPSGFEDPNIFIFKMRLRQTKFCYLALVLSRFFLQFEL